MDEVASSAQDLVQVYVRQHPDSAAQILEQLSPNEVALWFADTPEILACKLLERMLAAYSAPLLAAMPLEQAAILLSQLNASNAVAIVRSMEPKVRRQILDRLSAASSAQIRMLLNYSEDSVGAWMQADILVLPDDLLVSEALARLADLPWEDQQGEVLLVLNRDRRVRGTVGVGSLLRSDPNDRLGEHIVPLVYAIPGRMSLPAARQHEVWHSMQWVPVINRHRQFIGILRHIDLYRGLEKLEGTPSHDQVPVARGVVQLYGATLLTMFNLVSEMVLPASRGGKS